MASRLYDFVGADRLFNRSAISEAVELSVPDGTDENGITDDGDSRLDEAARSEARRFLDAWEDQTGVTFYPSGQSALAETIWRD